MKYFDYLTEGELDGLFLKRPGDFSRWTHKEQLRYALGGLLYIPGTDRKISKIVGNRKLRDASTVAVCLEDAVGDDNRDECIQNVIEQIEKLEEMREDGEFAEETAPLMFVRIKDARMLEEMAEFFSRHSGLVAGVILPKVTGDNLERFLGLAEEINSRAKAPFYAMPILESEELVASCERIRLLQELKEIAGRHEELILNIRIGATDLCGLYGIRRSADTSIYSVGVTASCISDIVRVFGLHDRYTISGPVWEYFNGSDRAVGGTYRAELAGLLREVALDLQNGLLGKTCIHPSQLLAVQAASVVPYEVYQDALSVTQGDHGRFGVLSSTRKNKMNELKPHALWAGKILRRAEVFGVYRENTDLSGLLRTVYDKEKTDEPTGISRGRIALPYHLL